MSSIAQTCFLGRPLAWLAVGLFAGSAILPAQPAGSSKAQPKAEPSPYSMQLGGISSAEPTSPAQANVSNEELKEALILASGGQLDQALAKSAAFVTAHPDSSPGHEVFGIVLVMQDKIDEGLSHLKRAVELNPRQSTAITKIGDVYFARGEIPQAKLQFQQALSLDPEDRLPHQRLGLVYEQEQDYLRAIEHFERGLVGAPPNYVGIKVNLGRLYNMIGRFKNTIELLKPVVDETSQNAVAHLVLGTAWLLARDNEQAKLCFERAKKYELEPEKARLALGIAYRDAGELEKSRQEFEAALRDKPEWSAAEFQLAETLVALKQIKDAVPLFEKVAKRDQAARASVRNRIAEVYAANNNRDAAIKTYEALRAEGLANVRTYDGWATLLQSSDKLDEAGALLQEACRKMADSARLQFRLGMHLAGVRDYDGALVALYRARQLAPADPQIQKAISLAELRRGRTMIAIAAAKRLLELVPNSIEDQFYLATLLEQAGQESDAEQLYEKVLRSRANHVGALNNLAQLKLKKNATPAALNLAREAARLAPENPSILDTLGWIQFKAGHLPEAIQSLEKAVTRDTPSPAHQYHLAVAYSKAGQADRALQQLDAALTQKSPFSDQDEAQKLAQQLRKK